MSDWIEGFHKAMFDAIAANGRPVAIESSYYGGWIDFDANWHMIGGRDGKGPTCEPTNLRDLQEDEWDEFDGTFNDSLHGYGVSAAFDCSCGQLKDRRLRWETSFGDALRTLTGLTLP